VRLGVKALQLHHENRNHDQDHKREDRAGLRLGALLNCAACDHVITRRQYRLECGEIGGERLDNSRCLKALRGISLVSANFNGMSADGRRG
jgi:hypothetical protein